MNFVKIALAGAALWPLASLATLGGAPATGTSAAPSLLRSAASLNSASVALPYSVRDTLGADGVAIREYVLPENVVFAVSWQGPVRPDMTALLGSYLPNFANAGAGTGRSRGAGPLVQHDGNLHIESAGRPGHFFGKAYLPRLVPSQVRVEELQ